MKRRRLLAALTSGGLGAVAGCLDRAPAMEHQEESAVPDAQAALQQEFADVDLPVPSEEMLHPLPKDHIPAITEPAFGPDWRDIETDQDVEDTTLPDEAAVLGVAREGEARAYPLRILNWHEIVNDEFGGPIAVTYCILCGSGVVVERRVAGEETIFGVSGSLWRQDLVMYDEATDSRWSQLLATAIQGPHTGDRLTILPSTLTTWVEWQDRHPDTVVLRPPPESDVIAETSWPNDYFEPGRYVDDQQLIGRDSFDGGVHSKTMVVGVHSGETARAYPFHVIAEEGVVNDRIGELPVVVSLAPDDTLVAYDRRVGTETLAFEADGGEFLEAGDSRWQRTTGEAVDGPHRGSTLERANTHPPLFWLGWSNFNPETEVYGIDAAELE